MPTIVMQKSMPQNKCEIHIQKPPMNIHITFISVLIHPPPDGFSTTLLPKGHIAKTANFNVWRPNGIPMMVIINRMLLTIYWMAMIKPPKMSQIMFPNIFILYIIRINCLSDIQMLKRTMPVRWCSLPLTRPTSNCLIRSLWLLLWLCMGNRARQTTGNRRQSVV